LIEKLIPSLKPKVMKSLRLLLAPAILFVNAPFVFAQDTVTKKKFDPDLFARTKNSYTLMQTGYYNRFKSFVNGQETSHSNSLGVNLEWNRWLGGGLGVGLNLDASWSGFHTANDQLTRNWTITPTVSYGKKLSENFNIYFRGGLDLGIEKEIYKTPTITNTDKANLFGYNGTIAAPLKISRYTFITPRILGRHLQLKYDDGKEIDNSIGLQVHLEDYLECDEMECDCMHGHNISKKWYRQGDGLIDYSSNLSLVFGNNKLTYNSTPGSYENNYNKTDINLRGSYYIIDHVAIGGGLVFNRMVQKSSDNTFTYTWNNFIFEPEVTANVPVENGWRNVFFRAGGQFGSERFQIKTGSNTNTDKYGLSGFHLGLGHNTIIADQTALSLYLNYRSTTVKEKGTDDKTQQRGPGVSAGLVHFF
jgi:hypothetical protein